MEPFDTYVAREAFKAYCAGLGGKAPGGADLPTWEKLPPGIKTAWEAAAKAARAVQG